MDVIPSRLVKEILTCNGRWGKGFSVRKSLYTRGSVCVLLGSRKVERTVGRLGSVPGKVLNITKRK